MVIDSSRINRHDSLIERSPSMPQNTFAECRGQLIEWKIPLPDQEMFDFEYGKDVL